ncbi:protein trichome birefringence-like 19 [Lycium barbarum]|uniref:protein trichome birefringence-like 19 n=1 Tax=Lycium barbarum TaxID=112863 RepID=UPI00293F6B92|nr:protein trichome birefringence-like 19 [Lycium barbarum]
MKFQSSELPIGKPQTRRKTAPKLAPLVAITILFTIIPIYYPSIRYSSQKKISEVISSNSEDTIQPVEDAIQPVDHLDNDLQVNHPCPVEDVPTQPCNVPIKEEEEEEEKEKPDKLPEKDEKSTKFVTKSDTTDKKVLPEPRKKLERRDQRARKKSGQRDFTVPKVVPQKIDKKKPPKNGDIRNLTSKVSNSETCDLFSGEWVKNPEGPYYTNDTCYAIQQHQNCQKFGRPDTDFLKWRWQPDACELPIFDPIQFLELVKGKSLAFVGDSVARNHMQSLICLLSRVVYPEDISETQDENRRWIYKDYDFNISMFWAPYLVRTEKTDPNDVTQPFNLYLDEFDEFWTNQIQGFDYVIISAGHWFFRPTMFYLNRRLVGCLYCPQSNVSHVTSYFSYRRAFRTAFRAINSLENYKGVTFLRTFAPSHFENGPWDKGGDCARTKPFKKNEKVLEDYNLEFYKIQLDELKIAQRAGRRTGLKFRLFDATQPMLLRPDGHPSKYGRWPNPNVTVPNDCVHWCLPGPIDAWNDFLVELLKREVGDS